MLPQKTMTMEILISALILIEILLNPEAHKVAAHVAAGLQSVLGL
jgi:hypothetical protein